MNWFKTKTRGECTECQKLKARLLYEQKAVEHYQHELEDVYDIRTQIMLRKGMFPEAKTPELQTRILNEIDGLEQHLESMKIGT